MRALIAWLLALLGRDRPQPQPQPEPVPPAPLPSDPNLATWELVQRHNIERAKRGLAPLVHDARLTGVARRHSDEMARRGVMTHDRESGVAFWREIQSALGRSGACAENVAAGYRSYDDVMAGWMGLPGHRANILGPYNSMGAGLTVTPDGTTYWTTDFADL